jgi:colanic acid biosynthesis glycosyl transferase WcaI
MVLRLRILLLNQTFHPDVAATAQYLTELAQGLAQAGHEVSVITSRRAYDDPLKRFPTRETWQGIEIHRVMATGFGKKAKWRRAADFASFILSCAIRCLCTKRPDVIVALTSPPLISFLGAWISKLRGARFVYWVMDLNPDEAIVAGWLREGSFAARILQRMSVFSFNRAQAIVVLDRFMQERIAAKSIPPSKIHIIPPWSHDDAVKFDLEGRDRFRAQHGLADKFVVMYSGNHSPCHPLDTLLEAARVFDKESASAADKPIAFCFVGGGSEFAKVKQFAAAHGLKNVLCLPYQPLAELSGSLSAADLHVVVMGDPFVGTIHPCKIYNVLAIGAPVLYVGPRPSHVTDLMDVVDSAASIKMARHQDVSTVLECIRLSMSAGTRENVRPNRLSPEYSKQVLLPKFLKLLTNL